MLSVSIHSRGLRGDCGSTSIEENEWHRVAFGEGVLNQGVPGSGHTLAGSGSDDSVFRLNDDRTSWRKEYHGYLSKSIVISMEMLVFGAVLCLGIRGLRSVL